MQYTLRNVPEYLDKALRQKAQEQTKSLNQVTLDILRQGLGLGGKRIKHRDLSDIAGSWVSDPEIDAALAEQRQIDPDDWA